MFCVCTAVSSAMLAIHRPKDRTLLHLDLSVICQVCPPSSADVGALFGGCKNLPSVCMHTNICIQSLTQTGVWCRAATPASRDTRPLRPSQARLLEHVQQGGNWIIVAKTGFGKTRVVEEVIRALLSRKKGAPAIFLTDKVMLAMQQAGTFVSASL